MGTRDRRTRVKKAGIYHPAINHLLASSGHTDHFTICDRGFPVPAGPERSYADMIEYLRWEEALGKKYERA